MAVAAIALAGCDVRFVPSAHAQEDDEPMRLTPQYGAPDYDPGPPQTPPPSATHGQDAGPPVANRHPHQ